ncbi:MAG TPA: hypothetical protein VIP53_08520 [Nitrososphaera sp.]
MATLEARKVKEIKIVAIPMDAFDEYDDDDDNDNDNLALMPGKCGIATNTLS